MEQYTDLLDVWLMTATARGLDITKRSYERYGWKSVHADLTSYDGFQWPGPGGRVTSKGGVGGPCPSFEGDGYCVAKTAQGAASGGIALYTVLLLAYDARGVLGEDAHKLRVRSARVLAIIDAYRADLSGAYLRRADLSGAAGTSSCRRVVAGQLMGR